MSEMTRKRLVASSRTRRVDYPKPIVDHDVASKENMSKMKAAYDAHKATNGDDLDGNEGMHALQ